MSDSYLLAVFSAVPVSRPVPTFFLPVTLARHFHVPPAAFFWLSIPASRPQKLSRPPFQIPKRHPPQLRLEHPLAFSEGDGKHLLPLRVSELLPRRCLSLLSLFPRRAKPEPTAGLVKWKLLYISRSSSPFPAFPDSVLLGKAGS